MKKIYKDSNPIKSQMKPTRATIIALLYLLASLFILGVFSSCKKQTDEGRWYIIKKGNHYSSTIQDRIFNRRNYDTIWHWEIMFDEYCKYHFSHLEDSANISDVNKLIGYADCGSSHRSNSVRIGWRISPSSMDVIELLSYVRKDGMFMFNILTTVTQEEIFNVTIVYDHDKYICCVNEFCDTIDRECFEFNGHKWGLFPYFGGNEVAPHRMSIYIKEI
jgi:hypothetical protein